MSLKVLPSSGSISMSQVRTELGLTSGSLSLGDSRVRALAGVSSGPISMGNLRGKSAGYHKLTVARLNEGKQFGFWVSTDPSGDLAPRTTKEYAKQITACMTYPSNVSYKDDVSITISQALKGTVSAEFGGKTVSKSLFNGSAALVFPELANAIRANVGGSIGLTINYKP